MKCLALLFVLILYLPTVFAEEITINLTLDILPDEKNIACNTSIDIETEKDIYQNGERIAFKNLIGDRNHEFIIEYWIEDLDGNILKRRTKTKNLNTKYFTPKIVEENNLLIIKNKLYLDCEGADKTYSEKIILVKNPDFSKENKNSDFFENDLSKYIDTKQKPELRKDDNTVEILSEKTVYKSENEKKRKITFYMMFATFLVLLFILIFKKKIFDKFI